MKKTLCALSMLFFILSCDKDKKDEPSPIETKQDTTAIVTSDKIDTYDQTITEYNADLIFSYSSFYHPHPENSSMKTLQRTATVTYLKNGVETYFDNKVFLNDTSVDFLFLGGTFGKYRTMFDEQWISKSDVSLSFDIRTGTTLDNYTYIFSNYVADTFDIRASKLYLQEDESFQFSLTKIPQNIDSIFVSLSQLNGDVEILKSFPASAANSFSFSVDEVNQILASSNHPYLMVSATKFLSAAKNKRKVYASFGSQVDYELGVLPKGL